MRRATFPILILCCVLFCACKDNVVCPAFQSTYILDDSLRMARYSLFLNDTTPKMPVASRRSKYGINKKSSLFKKNYDLMTAPKKNQIRWLEEDSLEMDQGEFIASDFVDQDTLGVDSVSTAPILAAVEDEEEAVRYKWKYSLDNNYNQEQVYYNKYYGELFIDTRPTQKELAAQQLDHLDEIASDSTIQETEKKGLFGRNKSEDSDVEEESETEAEVDEETLENVIETEEDEAEPEDTTDSEE
ncbi:hypothetical protein [Reichenbachiella ulvae]|uniref:Uncharacterized protein n=1 Tax=Reichenbachiella ulvae TaxID=2980104 RepID=A0ABT3CZ46_9BACT|nr:hypothetical protein [Reichenbachiella ulvae]MCV9388971.1 hypothetical protein [Reichenbachiella ulvae]